MPHRKSPEKVKISSGTCHLLGFYLWNSDCRP